MDKEYTLDSVYEKLLELICRQKGCELSDLKPTSRWRRDLNQDSIEDVEMVMALEEGFGILITEEEAESLMSALLFSIALAILWKLKNVDEPADAKNNLLPPQRQNLNDIPEEVFEAVNTLHSYFIKSQTVCWEFSNVADSQLVVELRRLVEQHKDDSMGMRRERDEARRIAGAYRHVWKACSGVVDSCPLPWENKK